LSDKAIKVITNKTITQIPEWQKKNPNYQDINNKKNDEFMQIINSSMGGSTEEEINKNYEKIIKNVAKSTLIEKDK
jgi:hypothetical protein